MRDEFNTIAGVGVAIIAVLILIGFFSTCTIIGPGERGVKVSLGKVSPNVYSEGMHFTMPFISHITKWDVKTQISNIRTQMQTKDIQMATISYTLAYHLKPEAVDKLQREVGKDYYNTLIHPVVEGQVKDTVGKQNASELIANRELVASQIKSKLIQSLNTRYFEITDFNITGIAYEPSFMKAIEEKVTAEQEALKAKNKTVQVQEEAKQKILTAEAEAKAIQLKAQALSNNHQLVALEYAKKWDGKLPVNMYGGNTVPFINVGQK